MTLSLKADIVLLAASIGLTYVAYVALLKYTDPNRAASAKARETKKEIAKRLNRPLIKTNTYEDVIACDLVNPDSTEVRFDSIGGLDGVKKSLYNSVILPLKRPELFLRGKLLGPPKGVLLYGPPGTGKTMLAKAIAKESGAVFINVRIANIMSKWFGDAEKLVSAVFSLAHKLEPAIIFIDEVDSFLGQRRSDGDETFSNMKTIFMSLWDGFATNQRAQVTVLAATNRPSELDEAILRRFTESFEIGMPSRKDRVGILKVALKAEKVEDGIDFDHIAGLCEGYSGSDLIELCKKAAFFSIQEFLDNEENGKPCDQEPRPLSQSDLESVIATSTTTNAAASEYNKTEPGKVTSRAIDDDDHHSELDELVLYLHSEHLDL